MAYRLTGTNMVFVFGEAMIELSGMADNQARIGVAGDTFNTAVYMSRAGLSVAYVTALGDDPFSAKITDAMRNEAINTDSVLTLAGGAPGLYAIDLDDRGERSFTYWRSNSAAKRFFNTDGADSIIEKMSKASTLYLSGITLSIFGMSARQKIMEIVKSVRSAGGHVVFDTNYRERGWHNKDEAVKTINAIMPYVSIALPTWEDERALFGVADAETCAARWHQGGASEVVVKAGERGAFSTKTGWVAPPNPISPLDTTGAGDSFNGAYLGARMAGATQKESMQSGHALAAKVLMTSGAILP